MAWTRCIQYFQGNRGIAYPRTPLFIPFFLVEVEDYVIVRRVSGTILIGAYCMLG